MRSSNMVVVGRYPDISEYGADYLNHHLGKHYNPAFNKYWADKIMELLEAEHVIGAGN
jgi:hypothetical protein